jgi:hypothetical protein
LLRRTASDKRFYSSQIREATDRKPQKPQVVKIVEKVRKCLYYLDVIESSAAVPLAGEGMPRTKKISTQQFARKFADIAEQALGKLPAEEQERRIAAFERAVSKISRAGNSKASRTHQTPATPLHTRARE